MDNVVNGYLDLISTIRVMSSLTAVAAVRQELIHSSSIIIDGGRSKAERYDVERQVNSIVNDLNKLDEYLNKIYKEVGFRTE